MGVGGPRRGEREGGGTVGGGGKWRERKLCSKAEMKRARGIDIFIIGKEGLEKREKIWN